MNADTKNSGKTIELVMEREFDAPRDLVWTVWTQPEHAKNWWGPDGFSTPLYECDLRPGGKILVHMQAPDGTIFPSTGTVEDVVPPERFVIFGAVEIAGNVEFEARTSVTFEDLGEKTKVSIRQEYSKIGKLGEQAIGGAKIGWTRQLDKLVAYLPTVAR